VSAQTIHSQASAGRAVRTLVALGDSATAGIGDPLPGGRWRGFGPLLAAAVGEPGQVRFANLSFSGARMRDVCIQQLPQALRLRPDAAVLVVGMNDTLRSDFDPARLFDYLDRVVGSLTAAGTVVVTARFHDHTRVFTLPGPLRRALRQRIGALNAVTDAVVARHNALCLDLHRMPGAYDVAAWSVDRLHPSELGHRMLARGFAGLLADAGCAVPNPVSLVCSGGAQINVLHHIAWLIIKGIPWLWRRGRDLLPYAVSIIFRDLVKGQQFGANDPVVFRERPALGERPVLGEHPGNVGS
jgi:lysophospholipase L1-like esterase